MSDISTKYDPAVLSEAEIARLLSALGDGFGYSHRPHREQRLDELGLPDEVEAGLLKHRAFFNKARQTEFASEDEKQEFWESPGDDDSPPALFEQCPVNFRLPEIRSYFLEQKAAYIRYAQANSKLLHELNAEETIEYEHRLYDRAIDRTYSKAWYEYHINEHIFFIDQATAQFLKPAENRNLVSLRVMLMMNFSVILGRLIEQYYWKFLVEKAAIRGEKISRSAKSGGHRRASLLKHEHVPWQFAANQIWQLTPTRSKLAVALIVKRRLKLKQSAKHISRVLKRP
jgi:hypothetical protein